MPSEQAPQATFWHVQPHLWRREGPGNEACLTWRLKTPEGRAAVENTIDDVYMAFYHPLGHQPQRREAYRQIPENATRR